MIPLTRAQIAAAGYESIAVGLIHSYLNDSHEPMPEAMALLSREVSPQMREYERLSIVGANAFIKPLMKSYPDRLKGRLADVGAVCDIFLIHSDGGIISLDSAASRQALQSVLGDPLGMNAATVAFGLAEVVGESMANAARVHAVENGEDLSDYAMIGFGGAEPLHSGPL